MHNVITILYVYWYAENRILIIIFMKRPRTVFLIIYYINIVIVVVSSVSRVVMLYIYNYTRLGIYQLFVLDIYVYYIYLPCNASQL